MPWIGAAISVAGGLLSADSAEDGFAAQEAGAARSDATQRYIFDTTRADNMPFLQNGQSASNRLAYLMGIGGNAAGTPGGGLSRDQLRQQLVGQFTTTGPGNQNPDVMYDKLGNYYATRYGPGEESYYYDPEHAKNGGRSGQTTIDEAGLNAAIEARLASQNQGNPNDPNYGALNRKFGQSDLDSDLVYQNGLQFGLDEGRKGVTRMAAAGGGQLSGATLKALTRFGNDYATTKTGDAYNRYEGEKTGTYNRLAGIAGSGQTAANQVASSGQNYANNVSNTAIGLGNARAASGIAGSNAIAGGLSGAYNNYQQNQLLKSLQSYRTPDFNPGMNSYLYGNSGSGS